MIEYLRRRKLRKMAQHCLQHARHCRNTRADVALPVDLDELAAAEQALRDAIKDGNSEAIEAGIGRITTASARVMPPREFAWFRENLEILVVAIAIAMGFRTYFIQPFKIPTGSMQPTLYGITSYEQPAPRLIDHPPLKQLNWLITGDWYQEIRAGDSGVMSPARHDAWDPSWVWVTIGGANHKIPIDAMRRGEVSYQPGEYVVRGAVLWAGVRRAGDHVFVDKVSWNFRRPRRGEVMVFNTRGIAGLEASLPIGRDGKPMSTHYIKRLTGLPTERISIDPPNVLANGDVIKEPRSIARIAGEEQLRPGEPHFAGYLPADPRSVEPGMLTCPSDSIVLADDEYFALGDNTANSRDSRYWGAVPHKNLLGPAFITYWPITRRWGLIR